MKSQSTSKTPDAITLLTDDHKKVQKLFKDFEKLTGEDDGDSKDQLVKQICTELTVHAQIEEEIFYPMARDAVGDDDLFDEAEVEHASAKELIAQLEATEPYDELYNCMANKWSRFFCKVIWACVCGSPSIEGHKTTQLRKSFETARTAYFWNGGMVAL